MFTAVMQWTLFITRSRLLYYFVFRTRSIFFYYLSIANGAGGVGIFELLVFQCFVIYENPLKSVYIVNITQLNEYFCTAGIHYAIKDC